MERRKIAHERPDTAVLAEWLKRHRAPGVRPPDFVGDERR
jgi:hypothetical protein